MENPIHTENPIASASDDSAKALTGALLYEAFLKRKQGNSKHFSLRNISKKVGVSHSYLSRVFQDEKRPSLHLIHKLSDVLQLDMVERQQIENLALTESKAMRRILTESKHAELIKRDTKKYLVAGEESFSLLDKWYYIAILDLTTCASFQSSSEWIADALKISVDEATQAIGFLMQAGYLKLQNGRIIKTDHNIVIPTRSTQEKVRQHHIAMCHKAIEILEKQTTDRDFQNRLMKGASFAVDPAKIPQAQEILNRAMLDIFELIDQEKCTDLYYMNIQLFPLYKDTTR